MKAICVIFLLWIGHVQSSCFKDNPNANSSWHWRPSIGSKYAKLENADQCLKKCLDDYNCVAITYWVAQKECYSFNFMVEEESCKDTCESKMITLPIPQFCNKLVNTYNQDNMRELQNACLPTLELCKKNMKLKVEIQLEKEETKERLEKLENKREQEIVALEAKIKNSTNKFQSGLQRLQNQQNYDRSKSTRLESTVLSRVNDLKNPECRSYMILREKSRSIHHRPSWFYQCDGYRVPRKITPNSWQWVSFDWGGFGWYRFMKPAGTMIPTSPPPENHCQTQMPGWMRGEHPSIKGQRNELAIFCFHHLKSTCWRQRFGKVTNCGSFFVYYLPNAPVCHARYCAV